MLLGSRALAAALQLQLLGYKRASHIENTKKPGLAGFFFITHEANSVSAIWFRQILTLTEHDATFGQIVRS